MGRVRGYLAMSLDGFIAGANDEVGWLEEPRSSGLPFAKGEWALSDADGLEFDAFLEQVGCIVMGRRTYDVVRSFGGEWQYGETPMLVVTSTALEGGSPSVTAIHGGVPAAIDRAREIAGDADIYVDGGRTIRAALDAGLLDHLVITMLPTALGAGISLFAGLEHWAEFSVERVVPWGPGYIQIHLTTR